MPCSGVTRINSHAKRSLRGVESRWPSLFDPPSLTPHDDCSPCRPNTCNYRSSHRHAHSQPPVAFILDNQRLVWRGPPVFSVHEPSCHHFANIGTHRYRLDKRKNNVRESIHGKDHEKAQRGYVVSGTVLDSLPRQHKVQFCPRCQPPRPALMTTRCLSLTRSMQGGRCKWGRYSAGTQSSNSPDGPVNHPSFGVTVESARKTSSVLSENNEQAALTSQTLMIPSVEHETRDPLSSNPSKFTEAR